MGVLHDAHRKGEVIGRELQAKAAQDIERLLEFGIRRGLLEPIDRYAVRNALLDLLRISEPDDAALTVECVPEAVAQLLEPLLDYAAAAGILEENNTTYRDLLDAKIMGYMMPRQSEVIRRFRATVEQGGVQQAADDFYQLCIDSNYIRMDRIANNLHWLADTEYGAMEITVNLSKPEKDPKEIALLRTAPQSHYPKCLLCVDNVGYAGRLNHPARQNLRVIPLELGGDPWYFQYSPYVYYDEHCIIFDEVHRPMQITDQTIVRLLDFVDQFPHYFVGSNADLPIVGGSILNHEHFQGGRHQFPMEKAPVEQTYNHPHYHDVRLGIVQWPMSVIRINSRRKESILQLASKILHAWRRHNDPANEILAYSESHGVRSNHNTITPIARKNVAGEYEIDLVLRNNRTSEQHPDGIFHPHKELHHIKKENIGLIEVMGLAVLPGRLKEELDLLVRVLSGGLTLPAAIHSMPEHPLHKHSAWIEDLITRHGTALSESAAEQVVQAEVGVKFVEVLHDAGVYKRDVNGRGGFELFLSTIGCVREA
ncbi:UDP-glucose--hexose-1-phosphate uridylyltransferase [Paenibacillus xerothermodurans]|uniref:Galactose-1-phosphate uridylyltransferase n=1 Tax=Paenibacillus xerothermodurans TaxID=1977292 RepID=A0A2W1NWS5_PAEXE|nr:UDP-glucose--hexose-1-phosphate uridylyltransferase [Paenibacillus xerothermodurans]PZE20122.1 UDP-glucose--hexose-1-phosphate uridylyltransferase [Paenibacillus xerothermodurans]